ncbi:hypothetical protein IFM89_002417 [Coptis chinensis]|uniref:FAS1 domain-containing protein n=1 Tax=Coptis chinensis TaxID=261450 RepID=A0A835IM08_9MAGN|nr:hypothetical protein IFM89_002417 [Coptis chinensis]
MASRFQSSFLVTLLFLSTFSALILPTQGETSTADHNQGVLQVQKIVKALSDADYNAMSLTLTTTLPTLINSKKNACVITIFSPPDKAFFSLKYPQPPLTLLEYHVAPMELDRDILKSSFGLGSKIDTLFHGHPLVVSTLPDAESDSINNVKITQWNIYNDGHVIVHGVDDFFDPAYQSILSPDGVISNSSRPSEGVPKNKHIVRALVIAIVLISWSFGVLFFRRRRQHRDGGDYILLD